MIAQLVRPKLAAGLLLILAATLIGCAGSRNERSAEELQAAVGWLDLDAQHAVRDVLHGDDLLDFAQKTREARKPPDVPRKSILILSSGGVYGVYPAGVLCGWTQAGTRPDFDVVTGVSTGAFLSVFAFLGSSTDCELRELATNLTNDEVYERRHLLQSVLSESLADNAPLARLIAAHATDERIRQVAIEHLKGRRLYVGTTDLDVRRAVVWDMGAIALQGTPECFELFRKILLASGAIPGFFPPVRIPVTVDGVCHVERHIDGGTSSSMFFVPPYVPPEARATLPPNWLQGSDLYIMVAGKIYPDPGPVKARTFAIVSKAVSTVIYDQTRSDLHKLFLVSVLTGMNYNVAAIPKDLPVPLESTQFIPHELQSLFRAGEEFGRSGAKWRDTPPGFQPGEGARYRAGTMLTDTGRRSPLAPPGGDTVPIPPALPEKK